jgi:hypothetical protein
MGTYHPIARPASARKKKRSYRGIDDAAMTAYLEDMITSPKLSVAKLATKHGLGISTASNWFNVFPNKIAGRKPVRNIRVAAWLKGFTDGENNLARLLKARPKHSVHSLILQEVADVVAIHDGEPSNTQNQRQFVDTTPTDVGHDRRVGPTGIGTFVPSTTDDLLVIRGEAQAVKDEVLVIASQAARLIDAIDLVRETLNTTDKLQLAMGRIDIYQSRIKELEATVDLFRKQKLASNQVHSSD